MWKPSHKAFMSILLWMEMIPSWRWEADWDTINPWKRNGEIYQLYTWGFLIELSYITLGNILLLVMFCDWWCFVNGDVLWVDVLLMVRFCEVSFCDMTFVRYRSVGVPNIMTMSDINTHSAIFNWHGHGHRKGDGQRLGQGHWHRQGHGIGMLLLDIHMALQSLKRHMDYIWYIMAQVSVAL